MGTNTTSQGRGRRGPSAALHSAHAGAVVATSGGTGADASVPSYLAPKRQRRAYGDKNLIPRSRQPALPERVRPGEPVAVNQLIGAMLRAHSLNWATTQQDNCRSYLLSPTGRFQRWCRATGVVTVDDLTTTAVSDFLAAIGDRREGAGLKPATVAKYRIHLRALARFQEQTPGYGHGLSDIHRIPAPRMPKERMVLALTRDEEQQVLDACTRPRDRLIIELLLATGLRVSEAAGLVLPNVLLTARPPRVIVLGSVHDPDCTKSRSPRQVPFRSAYAGLPRRLAEWIASERDTSGLCPRQELFLARVQGINRGQATPLGIWGFERLCQRASLRAGVHFSPHVLRHTWATRLVDAGVQPLHMMAVGGWSSIEMVRRYYTPTDDEVLAAIAAAGA